MRRVAFALVFILAALPEDGLAQTGDTKWVHDPSIAKEGGNYYVFSTGAGFGQTILLRRSPDLYRWRSGLHAELPFRGRPSHPKARSSRRPRPNARWDRVLN